MSLGYYTPLFDVPEQKRPVGFWGGVWRGLLPWGGLPRGQDFFSTGTLGYTGGTIGGASLLGALGRLGARALTAAPHPVARGAGALLSAALAATANRPVLRGALAGAYWGARGTEDATPRERLESAALGGAIVGALPIGFHALRRWRHGRVKTPPPSAPQPTVPPGTGAEQMPLFEVPAGQQMSLFAPRVAPVAGQTEEALRARLIAALRAGIPEPAPARGVQYELPLEEQLMLFARPREEVARFEGLFPGVIPMPTPRPLPAQRVPASMRPAPRRRGVPFVKGQLDLFTPTGRVSRWVLRSQTKEQALAEVRQGLVPAPVGPLTAANIQAITESEAGKKVIGAIARVYTEHLGVGTQSAAAAVRAYVEEVASRAASPPEARKMMSNILLGIRNLTDITPASLAEVIERSAGFQIGLPSRIDERLFRRAMQQVAAGARIPLLQRGTLLFRPEVVAAMSRGGRPFPASVAAVEGSVPLTGRARMAQREATQEQALRQMVERGFGGLTLGDLARAWLGGVARDPGAEGGAAFVRRLATAADLRGAIVRRVSQTTGLPEEFAEQAVFLREGRRDVMMRDLLEQFFRYVEQQGGDVARLPAKSHFFSGLSEFILQRSPDQPFTKVVGEGGRAVLAEVLGVSESALARRAIGPEEIRKALTVFDRAIAEGATYPVARRLAVQQTGFPTVMHLAIAAPGEIAQEAAWAASVRAGNAAPVLARTIARRFGLAESEVMSFAETVASQTLREPEDILLVAAMRMGVPVENIYGKVAAESAKRLYRDIVRRDPTVRGTIDRIFGPKADWARPVEAISPQSLAKISVRDVIEDMPGALSVLPEGELAERGARSFFDVLPLQSGRGENVDVASVMSRVRSALPEGAYERLGARLAEVVGDAHAPFQRAVLTALRDVVESQTSPQLVARGVGQVLRNAGLVRRYLDVAREIEGLAGATKKTPTLAARVGGMLHELLSGDVMRVQRDWRTGDVVQKILSSVEAILRSPRGPEEKLLGVAALVREKSQIAARRFGESAGALMRERTPRADRYPRGQFPTEERRRLRVVPWVGGPMTVVRRAAAP